MRGGDGSASRPMTAYRGFARETAVSCEIEDLGGGAGSADNWFAASSHLRAIRISSSGSPSEEALLAIRKQASA